MAKHQQQTAQATAIHAPEPPSGSSMPAGDAQEDFATAFYPPELERKGGPWFQCQCGPLPKRDVQAPTPEVAASIYRQNFGLNERREVDTKKIAG